MFHNNSTLLEQLKINILELNSNETILVTFKNSSKTNVRTPFIYHYDYDNDWTSL